MKPRSHLALDVGGGGVDGQGQRVVGWLQEDKPRLMVHPLAGRYHHLLPGRRLAHHAVHHWGHAVAETQQLTVKLKANLT